MSEVEQIIENQKEIMKEIEEKIKDDSLEPDSVNWLIPPEERKASKDKTRFILDIVKDKKITYPAEITMITGFSRQTIFDKLAKLTYAGVLEKIDIATIRTPPEELKRRLPELWATGLKGNSIKRMSWYRMAKEVKESKESEIYKKVD